MNRELFFVFVAGVALYLPAAGYGFVQDDRAIIVSNPAAHSIPAALAAFDDPYWPRGSGAGLYRPLTILSYAVDWTVSGGTAGWFHVMNALWHGLATVLFTLILMRWLPTIGAVGAGLLFAWHPVHVEAVASLVGRAELLAAVGIFASVLAARRHQWALSLVCAAAAMLSKEHGVIAPVIILFDNWLSGPDANKLPRWFLIALGVVVVGFLWAWLAIGAAGANDPASIFYGRSAVGRLAIALPAVTRAAALLVWPASLSSDYSPQVIPARDGFSAAALLGVFILVGVLALIIWSSRRAPLIAFTAFVAALSYLPTANLLFPSGVALAERNLYLAAGLPAAAVGAVVVWLDARRGLRPAIATLGVVLLLCGGRSLLRLPAWRDNRSQLLTVLTEHPESYRAHASAAAVLAGRHDTAGARREYSQADSLFSGDPYVDAAYAIFLIGIGDTGAARPLVERARRSSRAERVAWRAQFLLFLARHDRAAAAAMVDSVRRRYSEDMTWYLAHFH